MGKLLRAVLVLLVSVASMEAQTAPSSACGDSLYLALRRKPLDSMSTREYALFQERDRACVQTLTNTSAQTTPESKSPVIGQAQIRDIAERGTKDGTVATLFSLLIVGGGQMYSGEVAKGAGLLVGSIGAVAVGLTSSARSCDLYGDNCNRGPAYVGEGIAGVLWLYGVIDAHYAARRVNMYANTRSEHSLFGLRIALK
jgi:hypothetical protein